MSGLRWIVILVPLSSQLSSTCSISYTPLPSLVHLYPVYPALLLTTSTLSPTMNAEQNPTPNYPIIFSLSSPLALLSLSNCSMNCFEPLLAIVPRLSIISCLVIPIPLSQNTIYFFSSSHITDICNGSPGVVSQPLYYKYLYFSRASDPLDKSSLINTSASVQSDLATMFSNFFVSALNSCWVRSGACCEHSYMLGCSNSLGCHLSFRCLFWLFSSLLIII